MKPKCKNERFNQQHKIYEQGRRSQIAQLVSSLHSCLPRDHKPKKDKHTEILSSVLNYIQFLQKRTEDVNAAIVQEETRKELERLKAYVTDLEQRCSRYAKLLDHKGSNKPDSNASASTATTAAVPGAVSVIAASAPLVFLVSQQQQPPASKPMMDASTETEPFNVASAPNFPSRRDATTSTGRKATADIGIGTNEDPIPAQSMISAEVQVDPTSNVDRGCSPISFTASTAPPELSAAEASKKRQSTNVETAEGSAGPADPSGKAKRRRSDESTPTISEIVNLVAANGLGETTLQTSNTSAAGGKQSGAQRADTEGSSASLLSVSSLLQQQQQSLSKKTGEPSTISSSGPGTALCTVTNTVASSWYGFPGSDVSGSSFSNRDPSQQLYQAQHPSTQQQVALQQPTQQRQQQQNQQRQQQPSQQPPPPPHHSQQQQHQRHQQQQQQLSTTARDGRQQQSGPHGFQSGASEGAQQTYGGVETQNSTGRRVNENCSKNRSSSRRGANFSVEFLHGGGTNVASEQMQHDTQGQQRHDQDRATTQAYRQDGQEHASSSVDCGYYDLQHSVYATPSSQWMGRDQTWTSDPSYQWWTNQVPVPTPSFSQSASVSQSNQRPANDGGKSGSTSTNSNKQPPPPSSSGTRPAHEEQSCINLSTSIFDPNASRTASTAITSLTTTVSTWSTGSHGGYTTTNRFGYCAAPTLFTDPSFNYMRRDNTSRKTLTTSTAGSTLNVSTLSSAVGHSYPSYWSSNDWPSSAFGTGASSVPSFGLTDLSHGQHQNQGKAQNFHISTMFPEASLSGSSSNGASWRPGDGYRHQEHGQHAEATFGGAGMATTTASSYMMPAPTYR